MVIYFFLFALALRAHAQSAQDYADQAQAAADDARAAEKDCLDDVNAAQNQLECCAEPAGY